MAISGPTLPHGAVRPHVSVVVPVYGCADSLAELADRLDRALTSISTNYEVVLVDDASPDGAWAVIRQLAQENLRIRGVRLSRNFGQHYAISAGLDFARGEWTVVMDCDLQDMPEEIPRLYRKAQEGYDAVVGVRTQRRDAALKKFLSQAFNRVFNYLAEYRYDSRIGGFGVYSDRVVQSIRRLREQSRSFGLFALWVGFRRAEIGVQHAARPRGRSSYSFKKMVVLALDSIISHSDKLLRLTVKVGFAISAMALLFAAWIVVRFIAIGIPIAGWTSLIVSIYLMGGLVIGAIGITGLYIAKIFEEVKGRPLYIVESTTFEASPHEW